MSNDEKISLSDIYKLIKEVKEDLSNKIDNINADVKILTNKVEEEIEGVKQSIRFLEEENSNLRNKLENTERKLKSNNLIFYGIVENIEETQEALINNVLHIVNRRMEITLEKSEISNCYRIGIKNRRNRPVILIFVTQIKRNEIINNGRKLKGTDIYVKEDLTEKGLQEHRILVEHLKIARSNKQKAIIKGNKLYIDNQVLTARDLESDHNNISGYYSPPPDRLVSSEPPTPSVEVFEEQEEDINIQQQINRDPSKLLDKNDKSKKKNPVRKPSTQQTPKRTQRNIQTEDKELRPRKPKA